MRPYDRVLLRFPHPEGGRRGTLAFQRPSGVWSVQLDRGGSVEAAPAFLRPDPYLPPSGFGLRVVALANPGLDVAAYCLATYPEGPSS